MNRNNFVQGFGTISFDADSADVFGKIRLSDAVSVTVRGTRNAEGFTAQGDGVTVIAVKRKDRKPGQPVAVVTLSTDDGDVVLDMWAPKQGTAFGLSLPRVTRFTTEW